ncbi:MAG TPA: Crp/Fnr family transcriptional regulator [Sphingorhabdus lacus]|jgi:CRP/FNR family cyclic AMP-dependent transcriptional regulator|nr:Crp/Fnr family transcriptional regulator [Sphingorhabdus lacus]
MAIGGENRADRKKQLSESGQLMQSGAMQAHHQKFIRSMFRQSPVIGALDPDDVDLLFQAANVRSFARRGALGYPGEQSRYLFLVMSGQAELTTGSAEGGEVTIATFGAGSWVNWLAVLDPIETEREFQVIAGSTLITFPSALVRTIMNRNQAAYGPLYLELGKRFRAIMKWMEHTALSRDTQRLANLLVMLVKVGGDGHAPHIARLSQQQLARLSGCTRQTLNIRLGQLAKIGLIKTGYGRVTVPDLQALARFAAAT